MTARGRFPIAALIDRVIDGARPGAGGDPGLPLGDTIKRVEDGMIRETVDRSAAVAGADAARLSLRRRSSRPTGPPPGAILTDDAAVAEAAGMAPLVVAGSEDNLKVTTPRKTSPPPSGCSRAGSAMSGSARASMSTPSARATM